MASQRSLNGDWQRTWQAIHHQSHVAISLCRANVSDECVCVCVPAFYVCTSEGPFKQNGTEAQANLEKDLSCFRIILELKR